MKKILFSILVLTSITAIAQTPEDVIRLSWFNPSGTARSNALAGAMGSLGGDLSSNHINPAGLGFYKSGEFMFAPQIKSNANSINYFGNSSNNQASKYSIGTVGMVFAEGVKRNNFTSTAFSISFTKIADYNNTFSYAGTNNKTSFIEQFSDQLYHDGASQKQAEENYIYGSSLAIHSKLIAPILNANGDITDYQPTFSTTQGLDQYQQTTTTGGYNELAFGWGGNVEDKLYLGASFVMPMINYTRASYFAEDKSSTQTPIFDYDDNYSSKGFGLGAKFGIIYKPESFLRMGFTLHTPQIISFRDESNATMYSNQYPYASGGLSSSDLASSYSNNYYPRFTDYEILTPLKTIFSTSYFFASPNKPTQPLGFISADVEWVNYAGTKFYSLDNDRSVIQYYDDLTATVKDNQKNNINLKIGSEVKLNANWMLRAGSAYYGSPYKDESIKASRFVVSGGIGYRVKNHFIDFTLVNVTTKDALFPYRLMAPSNNYYADYKNNNLMFTIGYGFKFN